MLSAKEFKKKMEVMEYRLSAHESDNVFQHEGEEDKWHAYSGVKVRARSNGTFDVRVYSGVRDYAGEIGNGAAEELTGATKAAGIILFKKFFGAEGISLGGNNG